MPELRYDNPAKTMSHIFVTGISTDVGKTVASAVITQALYADYWKPVQAGDLDHSDSHKIAAMVSNPKTRVHSNAYALKTPMSPHAAAEIDGIHIQLQDIIRPVTGNHLVIEGAGGLLVPLNERDTIADLIHEEDRVIVVSRHYLGSINHSLLTLKQLDATGIEPALLFVGEEHPTTEAIIKQKTGVFILGRLPWLTSLDPQTIEKEAAVLRPALNSWLSQ